jgi:PEP-CTERM motif
MKKLFLALACSTALAVNVFAQSQTIALTTSGSANNSGSFNAGSAFSLDVNVTFTGFTGDGLSYWLQVPAALAPFISITTEQYFVFTDPTNPGPKTFISASGANPGFLSDQGASNSGDLGATANAGEDVPGGTYLVTTLNFTLAANAPVGTYTIRTTTLSPKTSEINDSSFVSHNFPGSFYTITVVPEPSTVAFLLGGAGFLGANFFRRRRLS